MLVNWGWLPVDCSLGRGYRTLAVGGLYLEGGSEGLGGGGGRGGVEGGQDSWV